VKIAQVTPYEYPYPGGVTEHVFHLDHCFREWGHEVKIIAPVSEDVTGVPENVIGISKGIVSIPFGGSVSRVTLSPSIYRPIKRLLREERFDVIHLHEPLTPTLALFVLRHARTVTVGTFHAYRERPITAVETIGPLLQPLMDKLDARICVSEAARDLVSHYFPGNYLIIPNGIDVQRFGGSHVRPVERFRDGRPTILFVGRLEKRKGFRYLMRAFPYVVESIPDARLIVVGAYEKEDKEPFVRYARMHRLSSVKFVGRVSGEEHRSVLTHGQEGLLVEPENEHALAEAITWLLQNPAAGQEMAERGRRTAARYNWPIIARQILDLYERLIQQKADTQTHA